MRPPTLRSLAPTLVLALLACGESPTEPAFEDQLLAAAASGGGTIVFKEELQATVFVPCANGGSGEVVRVRGSFVLTLREWTDAQGRTRFRALTNPQDVEGEGLTSGARYVGAGMTRESVGVKEDFTFTNAFLLVGVAAAEDLVVHERLRLQPDGDGGIEVLQDRQRITCR